MNEKEHYSAAQMALHWAVAVLVAAQFLFNAPISEAWRAMAGGLPVAFNPLILAHVAVGLLILALVVWRLVLRWRGGAPPPPANEPALLRLAAQVAHWSLYGLLVAMAVSGMAAWFGRIGPAAQAHGTIKIALLALIGLHVLAVVFHHVVLKNPILYRMIGGAKD